MTAGGEVVTAIDESARVPVLSVSDLTVRYGSVTALDSVSLDVQAGERVAIVGESGSGKSTLGNAIGGFLDPVAAEVASGQIALEGTALDRSTVRRIPRRTPGVSMIFQDAMSSLDPVWSVGSQLTAVLRTHRGTSRAAAHAEALRWLDEVGIPDPERVMRVRPGELSGGMRQRVMMAIVLASRPRLLVADEPTSALDASLSVTAMRLLIGAAEMERAALVVITHDIELCRRYADTVVVMYRGRIVEKVEASRLDQAVHPYTRGLVACVPTLETAKLDRLPTLEDFIGEETAA